MKHSQTLPFVLWVLLVVPLVHSQRTYNIQYQPTRRVLPFIQRSQQSRISNRLGLDSASTTARPVTTAAPLPTKARQPPPPAYETPKMTLTPDNDSKISHQVVDFMMQVSKTLAQRQTKTELFSPISIITVANLLFLGAGGVTHEEFGRVLVPSSMKWQQMHRRYGNVLANLVAPEPVDSRRDQWRRQTCPRDEDDYDEEPSTPAPKSQIIRLASGIFYQKDLPLRNQYAMLATGLYGAKLQPIDPSNSGASTAKINQWVSDMTAGKIRNMIEGSLSPSTSVVVANALYFKAKWKTQFEPLVTRDAPFFPDGIDKPSYRVKMMSLSGCLPFHRVRDNMDVSIVGLPYRDDTSTMYLIQPANSSRTAIRKLQNTLNAKTLDSWIAQMKLHSTTLRMPKMHLQNSVNLLRTFHKLGLTSILSPAKSDLSNMIEANGNGQKPYVNQILHKLDLTIDEEGTEGAAATSVLVDRIGAQRNFNGNTPFLVYLRHDATGLPLFYGPIFDPR